MSFNTLSEFIDILRRNNLLIEIDEYTNPVLEIAEITDRISKEPYGGKAILFKNTGTGFPVVTNLFGSESRASLALRHQSLEQLAYEIHSLIELLTSNQKNFWDKVKILPELRDIAKIIPKSKKGRGSSQEIIMPEPDLTALPILKLWPKDGGRFITLPVVHTIDPYTGARNVGMYRVQIFEKDLAAMHWHRHKTGARHFEKYKLLKRKMPVAITLGGDPVYTYVATAPLPEGIDEYILAGYIRKKPVELVKCLTQDIEVPEDADIVIEGYIDPEEDFILEGPFGDHTGFYSEPDYYPRLHITAITYKKNAIYPATIVGIPPQEDVYFAKATERIFFPMVKHSMLPEILDWDIPVAGTGHNLTTVKIKKYYPGHSNKIMSALWGAGQMMFNKIMIIINEDIDIHSPKQVIEAIARNYEPARDTYYNYGPMDVLDHASEQFSYGSKMGIDATQKLPEENITITKYKLPVIDASEIKEKHKEIKQINTSLIEKGIPVLIIAIEKKMKVLPWLELIWSQNQWQGIKVIVVVDDIIDVNDLFITTWLAANNIAPQRDTKIAVNTLLVDATEKNEEIDGFKRNWPDIALSDEKTIKTIDEKWEKLGFEKHIKSPSLKIKNKA